MSLPHRRDRNKTGSKASVDQRVRWPFKRLEGGPLPWHAGGRGFESRRCKLDEFADARRLAVVDTLTEVAASLAASRGRGTRRKPCSADPEDRDSRAFLASASRLSRLTMRFPYGRLPENSPGWTRSGLLIGIFAASMTAPPSAPEGGAQTHMCSSPLYPGHKAP